MLLIGMPVLPNKFIMFYFPGKFVPTIARKIHDENNLGAPLQINLGGLGVGDGFMSPPDSSIYADFLYQVRILIHLAFPQSRPVVVIISTYVHCSVRPELFKHKEIFMIEIMSTIGVPRFKCRLTE